MNLLVDGTNLVYRAVFGTQSSDASTATGSFVRILSGVMRKVNPASVIVVWDGGHSRWRHALLPDYKLKPPSEYGEEISSEARYQIQVLHEEILPQLPVMQLRGKRSEADDILYALTRILNNCVIASTDKDFYQLLETCDQWIFGKEVLYDKEAFEQDYGFPPSRWVDYVAMVGDSGDNIKGVHGIGPINANRIIRTYNTVLDCSKSDDKCAKILQEQYAIYTRNLDLVDLSRYRHTKSIQKKLKPRVKKLENWHYEFNSMELQQWLLKYKMTSMLRDYNEWIYEFERVANNELQTSSDRNS